MAGPSSGDWRIWKFYKGTFVFENLKYGRNILGCFFSCFIFSSNSNILLSLFVATIGTAYVFIITIVFKQTSFSGFYSSWQFPTLLAIFIDSAYYKHINQIGWENVKIECIEEYPCDSLEELLQKEQEQQKEKSR